MRLPTRETALRLAWALLVPLTLCLPLLAGRGQATPRGLGLLLGLSALALVPLLLLARTRALDAAAPWLGRHAGVLLGLGVAAYTGLSAWQSWRAYQGFSSDLHQLGLFAQSTWTTLHGHVLANTHESVDGTLVSHLGVHFSPTLFLLVPLYALWPSPLLLMLLQGLAVGLCAVPLYHLLRRDAERGPALVLAVLALALPSLGRAGWLDFHDATFLPVLLLTAAWALENRRTGIFLVTALAALGMREDTGLTLAAMGAWALLSGRGAGAAAGTALLGLAWLAVAVKWVMPAFAAPGLWIDPVRFFELHLGHWGRTPLAAGVAVLTHPAALHHELTRAGRLQYLRLMFQPMLVVPAFLDPLLLPGLPALAATTLSSQDWMRVVWKYHAILPSLFAYAAAARAASRLPARTGGRRGAAGLAGAGIVAVGLLGAALTLPAIPRRVSPPPGAAEAVLRQVPPGVPVYAPVCLYSRLANREYVGSWDALGARSLNRGILGRYGWIVLWPGGDPPGERRDAAVADFLRTDPDFRAEPGPAPFVVYRHR